MQRAHRLIFEFEFVVVVAVVVAFVSRMVAAQLPRLRTGLLFSAAIFLLAVANATAALELFI